MLTKKFQGSKEPGLYILDCSFSVLVIGTLVVFVWRGMWILCDLTIYTDDNTMSAWGSLVRQSTSQIVNFYEITKIIM